MLSGVFLTSSSFLLTIFSSCLAIFGIFSSFTSISTPSTFLSLRKFLPTNVINRSIVRKHPNGKSHKSLFFNKSFLKLVKFSHNRGAPYWGKNGGKTRVEMLYAGAIVVTVPLLPLYFNAPFSTYSTPPLVGVEFGTALALPIKITFCPPA